MVKVDRLRFEPQGSNQTGGVLDHYTICPLIPEEQITTNIWWDGLAGVCRNLPILCALVSSPRDCMICLGNTLYLIT